MKVSELPYERVTIEEVKDLLAWIPASECGYQDWVNVGMALKEEGLPCSVWDEWSRNDARYHFGECDRKWDTFGRGSTKVTMGTIYHMAQERGYKPAQSVVYGWDDWITDDGDGREGWHGKNTEMQLPHMDTEKYDRRKYDAPSVAVDLLVFNKDMTKILLITRADHPYVNKLALPGGFYLPDDRSLEYAAARDHYGKYLIKPNYINAGVLLFNMKLCRQTGLFKKARWWIKKQKLTFADQSALIRSTVSKKVLPQRFNDQKFLHKHTVVRHFSKRLFWLPYPHTDNIKQWHIEKVHSVFGYRQFDDIYSEYLKFTDIPQKEKK